MTRGDHAHVEEFLVFAVETALLVAGDQLDWEISMDHGCSVDNVKVTRAWPPGEFEHAYHITEIYVLLKDVRLIVTYRP